MESIYDEFMRRVCEGESFKVDLKEKSMRVASTWLIKGGEYDHERELIDATGYDSIPIEWIEGVYDVYKRSYPSTTEQKHGKKSYFKALQPEEMTDKEMIEGLDRRIARAALESMVLTLALSGKLKWKEEWGSWYYKGKLDPDFILLREGVE